MVMTDFPSVGRFSRGAARVVVRQTPSTAVPLGSRTAPRVTRIGLPDTVPGGCDLVVAPPGLHRRGEFVGVPARDCGLVALVHDQPWLPIPRRAPSHQREPSL